MAWKPDYATTAELREYTRAGAQVDPSDTTGEANLAGAIAAASRGIETACGRQFGKSDGSVSRLYTARWDDERALFVVDLDDLYSADDLKVEFDYSAYRTNWVEVAATNYFVNPLNAAADGRPYTQIVFRRAPTLYGVAGTYQVPTLEGAVRVTSASWGWSAVPPTVKEACLLQASRLAKRADAPFGIAGAAEGAPMRLLPRLDPDVAYMLLSYKRLWPGQFTTRT